LAFIGTGRMAGALITNLIKERYCAPAQIIATHHDISSISYLEREFRVKTTTSNASAIELSEIIFLCVRPQQFPQLISEIGPFIKEHHIVISIAVGVPIDWLRMALSKCNSVFHVHPPSTVFASSKGLSFIALEENAPAESGLITRKIFRAFGEVIVVHETDIDSYAVFAGCSPAFVARMAGDWFNLAIENGISEEIAKKITLVTFQAITNGINNLNMSLKDFERKIATPNGVTEMGLKAIEKQDLTKIFLDVVNIARDKIKRIKDIFNLVEQE